MASGPYGTILGADHPFLASQSISSMWSDMVAPNFSVSFAWRGFGFWVSSIVSLDDYTDREREEEGQKERAHRARVSATREAPDPPTATRPQSHFG